MDRKLWLVNIFLLTMFLVNAQQKNLVIPFSHAYGIQCIDISADGKYIVSGGLDSTLKLWDTNSKKLLHTFGHPDVISAVAISKDNRYIVSGSWDNTIKLWDVISKELLHTFEGHIKEISDLKFFNNDSCIISKSLDGELRLWEIENKTLVSKWTDLSSSAILFLLENNEYVLDRNLDGNIRYGSIFDRKQKAIIKDAFITAKKIDLSDDYTYAVNVARDGTINLWDFFNKKLLHTFENQIKGISAIKITPDNKYIIAAVKQNIMLWDIKTRQLLYDIPAYTKDDINDLAISDNGIIVTCGGFFPLETTENDIKIWDIESLNLLHTFKGKNSICAPLSISADNRYIVYASEFQIKLLDLVSKRVVHTYEKDTTKINAIAISKDAQYIASVSMDKTLKLWDVARKRLLYSLQESDIIWSVCISSGNRYLIYRHGDNKITLRDLKTKKRIYTLTIAEHYLGGAYIAVSEDSRYLVGSINNGDLLLWNLEEGTLIRRFPFAGEITSLKITEQYILAGTTVGVVVLIDLNNQKPHVFYKNQFDERWSFAADQYATISNNDKFVASSFSATNEINLWDTQTKKLLHTFEGHGSNINAIEITADNKYIISGSYDNTIKIWDIAKHKLALTLYNFEAKNAWVATTPDGKYDGSHAGLEAIYYVKNTEIIPLDLANDPAYTSDLLKKILQLKFDE